MDSHYRWAMKDMEWVNMEDVTFCHWRNAMNIIITVVQ